MTKARTLGNFVSTGNPLSDGTIAASEVTGLATVATSGSYNDLSNKPTITTTATNIAGGSNGTIPYQSAADTTQMLAAGTSGYFLKSNGVAAPSWDAVPATTPAGSSGQLQYNNAGAFAAVSSGTSGQLLTSAGSGAVPTWTTPSSGALVFITSVTASSASTVDIENAFTAYDRYLIVATGISVSGGSDLFIRTKHAGAYRSTSYLTSNFVTQMASSFNFNNNTNNTEINVYGNGFLANRSLSFTVSISRPSESTPQILDVQGVAVGSSTAIRHFNSFVTNVGGDPIEGVRIFGSTFTGTFRLYAFANS